MSAKEGVITAPRHSPPAPVRQLPMSEIAQAPSVERCVGIDGGFPEKFVDELSRREVFNKHLFRPNAYLHKWWARRCGSLFRAILKQFAPDDGLRDYYAPGGLEGKVVLDPMMGGGTTLQEAMRLGANVIGADIDPIPVAQARASLSAASLPDLRAAFDRFHAALYAELGDFFQTECPHCDAVVDVQYALHGVRKRCACGEAAQIDQYILRRESDRDIRICPDTWRIGADAAANSATVSRNRRLIEKSEKTCPDCGSEYADILDVPFYARYVPVATAAVCASHGFFFRPPSERDFAGIERANALRADLDFAPIADFAVKDGPKSADLLRRGVRSYLDLFSSRQLLYIRNAATLLERFDGVEKLNLAMLVSTSLEFNSMMCGYKGWYARRPGAIRHVFALHAYSFPYTALENNPVNRSASSGNLRLLFRDRIERGRKWAATPVERRIGRDGASELVAMRGETVGGVEASEQTALESGRHKFMLIHGDSGNLPIADRSVDMVVTDPPYYDSVQYSDLAAFFRVWLARLLPDELEWVYDESQSAVAGKTGGDGFLSALAGIFRECARVLKPDAGRMVFTFHHWRPDAWAELSIALKRAGFRLTNAYAVYSEHPISVHIRNLNSIKHDSVLVFAAGDSASAPWPMPAAIETTDSETFCRQCAAALGWALQSDELSETEIRAAWKRLIRKGNGGRTK